MHPHLYRRQFLLGPRPIYSLPEWWQRVQVGDELVIHAHPDLLVTQREQGGIQLTLLGFAIDPHYPERGDTEILDALLDSIERAGDVLAKTDPLGGRWVLVAADAEGVLLFNDASGLRQVVYTRDGDDTWCASQPTLLGQAVSLTPDPEVADDPALSSYLERSREPWWPGDRTCYAGVHQLLPNYVLDLSSGNVQRFWPAVPLAPRSLESGVEEGSSILRGLLEGASRRFPLSIAMTAGFDSRVLLAACREIAARASFFTHLHYGLDETHPDAAVSRMLLERLGLSHRTIDCIRTEEFATSTDPDIVTYRERYLANTSDSHLGWGAISYTLSREIPPDHVVVKANCNEIVRRRFRNKSGDEGTDLDRLAEMLARYTGMRRSNTFAVQAFREWAEASVGPIESLGYDAYDLAYCEQRMGRWQAQDQLERDMDHETFVPFNSREYFSTLLGVPTEYRRLSERLQREMIKAMWPELLQAPINPRTPRPLSVRLKKATRNAFLSAIRAVIVRTGTLDTARRIFYGSK